MWMGHRLWCETGYWWRTVSRRTDRLKHRKRGCEEMNPHFFTAPFYFAFIWFRGQGWGFRGQGWGFRVEGWGFRVQGWGFRVEVAASPPFFRRWYSRIAAFPSRVMLSGSILGTLTYCKIFFPLFFLERLYAKIIRLCRKKKALCRYFLIESNISLEIMGLSCFFGVFVKVKEDGGLWVIFL